MSFPIEPYRESLAQITESVFDTMLQRQVVQSTVAEPISGALTAAVYYAGSWRGAVLLQCSLPQARAWTAQLLSLTSATDGDARDGLGELANVLAGNLKPLLPPGVGLSMPSVVDGTDYSIRLCGENLAERLDFQEQSGPFSVTLVEVPE